MALRFMLLACGGLLAAAWVSPPHYAFEGLASYLPLHTAIETVSIVVSALVFGVVWNAYARERDGGLVGLACAFLAVAILDFVHTLSYTGMPEFVTPAGAEKSIFFWMTARLGAALGLLALALRRPGPFRSDAVRRWILTAWMVAAGIACWIGLFHLDELPDLFVEGKGLTPLKVGGEYVLIALFVLAGALLYRRSRLLAGAAGLSALSELAFTLYATVTDVFTLLGHVYKVAAYLLIYRAVFVASVREPFTAASDRARKLARAERIAHVGTWEVDLAANRLVYSDAALDIHGLTREQFDGTLAGAIALAHPDDRVALTTAINATLYDGEPFSIDYRIVRPDGSVRHVHVEDEVERDARGRPLRAFGITQDITERKEAENALRESDERYRSLVSAMAEGIVMQESSGAIVACNQSAERILGLTSEQLFGRTSLDPRWQAIHEDGSPFPGEEHPAMLTLRSGLAQSDVTMGVRKPDGSLSWISINSQPLVHAGEAAPYAVVTTFHDITARKAAERALREEQQRLELLADNVPAMIAYVDAETHYRYTNRRYRTFYAGSDASVGGRTIAEVLTDQAWAAARPQVAKALAGEAVTYSGERRLHDGQLRYVSVSLVPHRDPSGAVLGIYILALDTTSERTATLALLEQQRRLELIADNVPAMIAYVDAGGRFGYANLKHRLFHTGSAASIEGRSVIEVLGEGIVRTVRPQVARALAGEPVTFTDTRPSHDGTPADLAISLVPHRGEGDAVLGYYALLIDITAQRRAEMALRESEAGLRHAQEMARIAHVTVRPDGSYERWSESWPRLLGFDPSRLPRSTRDSLALVHPEDRERFRAAAIGAARSRVRTALEYRFLRGDGTVVHVHQSMEPLASPGEGAPRWFVTLQDVTEQKRAEERIRRLNRVYAVLSGINTVIVRVRDRDELFREAARVAVEAGGFRMAWLGVVDRQADQVRVAASAGAVGDFFEDALMSVSGEGSRGAGRVGIAVRSLKPAVSNDVSADPDTPVRAKLLARGINSLALLPLIVESQPIGVIALHAGEAGFFDDEEMKLLLELADDISFALDHIGKEERVRYLAYYDELTGLANRTLFLERASQQLAATARAGQSLALLIINIDRFKTINDTLGRQAGDALLGEFGRRLQKSARDPALVARVAADHFGVLLPDVKSEEDLIHRLERGDARVMAEPFAVAGTELRIATRSGVAVFPQDAADAESLFRNAEAALKRAKPGEKYLFYRQEMTERIAETLTLENRLRTALRKSEFVLHYQPKLHLATRRVSGVEALIRWASPEGLIPPGQFIPLLEETGLILPVGEWAMQQAVADILRWRGLGLPPVRVAVNVSALQLRQRDFVARLSGVLAGASPAALDLEITESLLMEDVAANIEKLKAVNDLGVNVAIDDFGTGYSSLSYLSKLPAQALKIDRSFVAAMAQDSDTMTLVSTIVSLARSLRLTVIAEGVETQVQESFLRGMRCDEAQGYLYAKPMPADELEKLLRKHEAG